MILVSLPDGSTKQFGAPITVAECAAAIGPGLAKAAVAGEVNGVVVDTSYVLTTNASLRVLTAKDPESLEIVRHSAAHLLAQAVKILFPTAQVTIGPVIADGFYYDFAYERSFTPHDLELITAQMYELVAQNLPIVRHEMPREEAIDFFKSIGEHYKAEIIADIPTTEPISLYRQGDFVDLCRGPHVPSTGFLQAVHLTKVAGAYWRGDQNQATLQRIYGTAWLDKKSLATYLYNLAEAEKRDHRKIGKQLDLFHLQDESPGMIFWHPNGWIIYQTIKSYISERLKQNGYEEVVTPQLVDASLWKKSGHWDMFADNIFVVDLDDKHYVIKPMNCPCHIEIFKQKLRSYRELPIRLAEFGCVHRNEASGALHGLMRVKQMTQDDAHIFCTDEQIQQEALNFMRLVIEVYRDFGFNDIAVKLSTRPVKRIGDDELWDHAEEALAKALLETGLTYEVQAGEGAFYGPKVEFHLKDSCSRVWQCGTLQLDYSQPHRLGASYIASDGSRKVPVMLHRAILGSIERFIGVLIEHYAGKLPLWLSPIQVVVANISQSQFVYGQKIFADLQQAGLRVFFDSRNEKIGLKIREHTLKCVPYFIIIGDIEVASNTVKVRDLAGQDLGAMQIDEFIALIKRGIASFAK